LFKLVLLLLLLQAPAVTVEGRNKEPLRYCFQCAKLEPLCAFEGKRR
jgi:hypothetical protein